MSTNCGHLLLIVRLIASPEAFHRALASPARESQLTLYERRDLIFVPARDNPGIPTPHGGGYNPSYTPYGAPPGQPAPHAGYAS